MEKKHWVMLKKYIYPWMQCVGILYLITFHSGTYFYRPQGNIFSSVCQEFCSEGESTTAPPYTPQQGRPPWQGDPLPQCILGDTGNQQAVRILLECIFVIFY